MSDNQKIRIECGNGAAFDNDPKTNAHPRYKGSLEITKDIHEGDKIEIAMWINTARKDGATISEGDKYLGIRVNKVVQSEDNNDTGEAPERVRQVEGLF